MSLRQVLVTKLKRRHVEKVSVETSHRTVTLFILFKVNRKQIIFFVCFAFTFLRAFLKISILKVLAGGLRETTDKKL